MTVILLAFSCRSPPAEGTSVGNPTEMTVVAAESADLQLSAGGVSLETASFWLDDETDLVEFGQDVDLFTPDAVELPSRSWDVLVLELAAPLWLEGTTSAGQEVSITLAVESVALVGPAVFFDGDRVVLEVGEPGWLDALELGYDPAQPLVIEPTDALHDRAAEAVGRSGLFLDGDGDGQVSEDERQDALAEGRQ